MTDLFDADLSLELKYGSDFLFAELKIFRVCGAVSSRVACTGCFFCLNPGGGASSWREGLTNHLTTTERLAGNMEFVGQNGAIGCERGGGNVRI